MRQAVTIRIVRIGLPSRFWSEFVASNIDGMLFVNPSACARRDLFYTLRMFRKRFAIKRILIVRLTKRIGFDQIIAVR